MQSTDAVRTAVLSGEKHADLRMPVWPCKTSEALPGITLQTRAVWSCDAVTMARSSGENVAEQSQFLWPRRTWRSSPVVTFQS